MTDLRRLEQCLKHGWLDKVFLFDLVKDNITTWLDESIFFFASVNALPTALPKIYTVLNKCIRAPV